MFENVVFTSRYGSAGPPSWLRGCYGRCEAMGWYPVYAHEPDDPHACRPVEIGTMSVAEAIEVKARIDAGQRQADGLYFLRCPECHGSGRVSWWVTLARIPLWIVRGVRTCWELRPSQPMHCPEWSWGRRAWIAFKVAFLCDLGWRM